MQQDNTFGVHNMCTTLNRNRHSDITHGGTVICLLSDDGPTAGGSAFMEVLQGTMQGTIL